MKRVLPLAFLIAASASVASQTTYEPPGRLVDIGGRRIHLHCSGAGTPAVVLEAGASSFSIDWALVQSPLSQTHRACSYDRAGAGWSDPVPLAENGEQVARDLRAALTTAGEEPPYLLVGASRGGVFVRMYHRMFPGDVMGMVLVDGTHEDGLFTLVNGEAVAIASMSAEAYRATLRSPPIPIPVPAARLQAAHLRLPADLQPVRLWLEQRTLDGVRRWTAERFLAFQVSDHATLAKLHAIDTSEREPLGDLPLVVLSRGVDSNDLQVMARR